VEDVKIMNQQVEPTEAQQETVWKWCGFKFIHTPYTPIHGAELQYPDGHIVPWHGWGELSDLNNLKEYIFPKLLEEYDIEIFSFHDDLNHKVFWFVKLVRRVSGEVEFTNMGRERLEDAVLEICWEVIYNGE